MGCNGCGNNKPGDKLKSIFDGWKHLIWENEEVEKVAKDRADICSRCDLSKGSKCKQCGCYIPAKIRSMTERCELSKWEAWE